MYVCVFTFAFFIFMYIKNVVIVVLVVVVVGIVVFFSSYLVLFLFMLSHFRLCALGLYIHLLRSWPRFADVDIHTNSYIYTQKHTHTLMHTCVPPLKSVGHCMRETLAPKLTNTLHNHNCHMVLLVDLPFLLFSSPTLVKQIFPYDLVSAYVLKY